MREVDPARPSAQAARNLPLTQLFLPTGYNHSTIISFLSAELLTFIKQGRELKWFTTAVRNSLISRPGTTKREEADFPAISKRRAKEAVFTKSNLRNNEVLKTWPSLSLARGRRRKPAVGKRKLYVKGIQIWFYPNLSSTSLLQCLYNFTVFPGYSGQLNISCCFIVGIRLSVTKSCTPLATAARVLQVHPTLKPYTVHSHQDFCRC